MLGQTQYILEKDGGGFCTARRSIIEKVHFVGVRI